MGEDMAASTGGRRTVRVKAQASCIRLLPVTTCNENTPPLWGVPDNTPPTTSTPAGSAPSTEISSTPALTRGALKASPIFTTRD